MECIPEARIEANKRCETKTIVHNVPWLTCTPEENPGAVNLTAVTREISERWKSLSNEDRITVTADCMQEIEEDREVKSFASHNVPLTAFYDARSTLQAVEKEVSEVLSYLRSLINKFHPLPQLSQLYARTGLEFLLVACRSNTKDFMKPFIYFSSEVVKNFIADSLNRSLDDFGVQLEAYVMSGLKGMQKHPPV